MSNAERRAEVIKMLASGDLVNLTDAARVIGISKSTLSYRSREGLRPNPIGRLGKSVVYWLPDVIAERDAREQGSS